MNWLKAHYEKASLLAGGLVAIACAVLVFFAIGALPEQFVGRDSPKPPDHTIQPPPVDNITAASQIIAKPREWAPAEGSLFVSRPYVLKDGELIDPLEGGEPLHPPIPNAWLIQNDLDYADSSVKEQDPDNDGFTNLEEFLAGTNPTSKASIPPYHTKLRLLEFIAIPFRLIFTGSPDDGQTFTINSKDLSRRTQFLKIGDSIEGSPYKIVAYEKKSEMRNQIERDVSELTIENSETGQKIVLVTDAETNDPTSFAKFRFLLDNSEFQVKKDDEFALPAEPDVKYRLLDISPNEAVIEAVDGGEQIKIPKKP